MEFRHIELDLCEPLCCHVARFPFFAGKRTEEELSLCSICNVLQDAEGTSKERVANIVGGRDDIFECRLSYHTVIFHGEYLSLSRECTADAFRIRSCGQSNVVRYCCASCGSRTSDDIEAE